MELEVFKSAWRRHTLEGHLSRPVRFVRSTAIHDLQRSEEMSRLVFAGLFGLLALAVSFVVVPPGAARIGARMLAAALLGDAIAGVVLLARRARARPADSMVEFIARENRQLESRMRMERYSQWLTGVLGSVTLILLLFYPTPAGGREKALETLFRMVIMTAFLAVAWRRAKSRSKEIHRELQRYLRDFE